MIGFGDIDKVLIPRYRIENMYRYFRFAGANGYECVGLFAGKQRSTVFEITESIVPKQKSFKGEVGLMYSVDGEELHKINVELFNKNLILFAQIHTHPRKAYHSEMDDAYPIVATVGSLSIVVPNFAKENFSLEKWAVYRLSIEKTWDNLSTNEVKKLITII